MKKTMICLLNDGPAVVRKWTYLVGQSSALSYQ